MHFLRIRPLLVIVAVLAICTVVLVRSAGLNGQPVSATSSPSGRTSATTSTSAGKAPPANAARAAASAAERSHAGASSAAGQKQAGGSGGTQVAKAAAKPAVPAPTTSTLPPATTTTTAPPAKNGLVIGISLPALLGEPAATQAAWLANLKSIGVTSIRLGADWAYISYAGAGTYDWGPLDQEVASIRAAGMSIDMVIMGAPSWAAVAGEAGTMWLSRPTRPPSAPSRRRWRTVRAAGGPGL